MSIKKFQIENSRRILLFLFDLLCFAVVDAFYLWTNLFVDEHLKYQVDSFLINSLVLLAFIMASRLLIGVYTNLWRYTNTTVYLQMVIADGIGCVLGLLVERFVLQTYTDVWHFTVVSAFMALLTLTSRFVYRQIYKYINLPKGDHHKIPVCIVGAGQMGALLAEELLYNKHSNYKPIFFIDRNPTKVGGRVVGLKVYAESDETIEFIKKQSVSEIFIAVTGLDSEETAKIYHFYSQTTCKIKLYDSPMKDFSDADPTKRRGRIREFQIEDLLFRKSLNINDTATLNFYVNKTVLVTGGGGSIGSELCRQIAKCSPRKLIILDIYENNAYEIQQELIRCYGDKLNLEVEIASVRDVVRLEAIFRAYKPDIVFHAAAHKHVPLMEHSGCEAIKNNVIGTYNTANMAEKYGVQNFILVSTDKAVNPTNIMGASKRMCEMVIQCRGDSATCFAAVRFGNVLGSNGSVIPLFKRQIENGGPLTITDKRIIRYFMTIPEASQLVIRAGAMAKKGELFVLDMGKPVRIYDLAVNMIKLSGFEPEVDIKIKEIGLRPGEKLYEELLMKTEELTKTDNDLIFVEKDTPLSREEVEQKLAILRRAVEEAQDELSTDKIKAALHRVVPTFRDPDKVNKKAENAEEMKEVKVSEAPVAAN